MFGGISEGIFLFALGLGYFICYFAKKTDEDLRRLGHVVGMLIISLATFFILINLVSHTRYLAGL